MTETRRAERSLGEITRDLKILLALPQPSAPQLAQLFVSATGLLCELKSDKEVILFRAREGQQGFPELLEVPAISAVLNDAELFGVLLRTLRRSGASEADGHSSVAGRKRSLSISEKKISVLSPVPSRTKSHELKTPKFDVPVFAATALFSVFRWLDHWPAPLIQAYADDCFGPRNWVDKPQCAKLVENLALVHSLSRKVSVESYKDAGVMAQSYNLLSNPFHWIDSGESDSLKRRAELKRGNSETSWGSVNNKAKRAKQEKGKESDSGKEESDIQLSISDLSGKTFDGYSTDEKSSSKKRKHREHDEEPNSLSKKSNGGSENASQALLPESSSPIETQMIGYPISQKTLNVESVRQRYVGPNYELAHNIIAACLAERVDIKSKHNSGLLQCLPSFTSIPGVRVVVASCLEKWLQSPALAGLARKLLAATVKDMRNVDPPLEEDLQAIDSILGMKLKTNQNVTAIAKKISGSAVAELLYSSLLQDWLVATNRTDNRGDNLLNMIGAIHREMPSEYAYDAIATAMLTFLANPKKLLSDSIPMKRVHLLKRMRDLLRALSSELGSRFDGTALMNSLMALDVSHDTWSSRDEQDKAYLMHQCITLSIASYLKARNGVVGYKESEARRILHSSRISFLNWFCAHYGPRFFAKNRKPRLDDETSGPGPPDYRSAVGPDAEKIDLPSWLKTMSCLLFLEDVDSLTLTEFVGFGNRPDDSGDDLEDEMDRIRFCNSFGLELDDDIVGIVLKATSLSDGIDSGMAILLLEHLFRSCTSNKNGRIRITDPELVWELYTLVVYTPSDNCLKNALLSQGSEENENGRDTEDIPRLAYTGLWWRVTMLALVICASAPSQVGITMWNEHPTLCALLKMVTSSRYRFPTVDCDNKQKSIATKGEHDARELEASTAERLFLPPRKERGKKSQVGLRMSRRLLKQQQEREAAEKLAESARRKHILKETQRAIMIWDPDGPARKPPKECVGLLLSVAELFCLSETLQNCVDPDFILKTIGQTSRGAIERAYDWLIPIVSSIPATISRLPSNASCFLLLRAYGTAGDERKQLKELAAPLLSHVSNSLRGIHGESSALKAFELLMTDVASDDADRRRCSNRVLNDALCQGGVENQPTKDWTQEILNLSQARSLVSVAISYLSKAATMERGQILASQALAFKDLIGFALNNQITADKDFPAILTELISTRPTVFADAMANHKQLLQTVSEVLLSGFRRFSSSSLSETEHANEVKMSTSCVADPSETSDLRLPQSWLSSVVVLLSVCHGGGKTEQQLATLADSLLLRVQETDSDASYGLASAKLCRDGTSAVSIDLWAILIKARSDEISLRTSVSIPLALLPRMLICSGLRKDSIEIQLNRLNKVGAKNLANTNVYSDLLRGGPNGVRNHSVDSRILHGRVSAWLRLHNICSKDYGLFLSWLSEDKDKTDVTSTKQKQKHKKQAVEAAASLTLSSIVSTRHSFDRIVATSKERIHETSTVSSAAAFISPAILGNAPDLQPRQKSNDLSKDILDAIKNSSFDLLDDLLRQCYEAFDKKSRADETVVTTFIVALMDRQEEQPMANESALISMLQWIPRFSRFTSSVQLWKSLFDLKKGKKSRKIRVQILSNCLREWTSDAISRCRDWVLSADLRTNELDCELMTHFLVSTCNRPSPNLALFSETLIEGTNTDWASSKEFVMQGTAIAIQGLKQMEDSLEFQALGGRHDIPPGFTLVFLLARRGKNQLRSACGSILQEIVAPTTALAFRRVLDILFLRLYLCFPVWMDLGKAASRDALMRCSEAFASMWGDWPSSFDDQIEDMLDTVGSGDLKGVKSFVELSRKQPLLVLRKISRICEILEVDATCQPESRREQRGIVLGRNLSGNLELRRRGKVVTIRIQHWGYCFWEHLWVSMLDILTSMPDEVLFFCGLKVGFLDLLGLYLQLMSVQPRLLPEVGGKPKRLKGKLADVFESFRKRNGRGWKQWLGSTIGDQEVRHLLILCDFISPQDAIESLK